MEITDSSSTLAYTSVRSGYLCVKEMYNVHISSAYVLVVAGLLCFITRLVPKIKFLHVYFGRIYVLALLWGTASSLLIINTGLPSGTIVSFAVALISLSLGWAMINIHQYLINSSSLEKANAILVASKGTLSRDISSIITEAKTDIVAERSTWQQIFSLKTLHGAFMFTSWLNFAGRLFVTNPADNFECYTIPVYKNITSNRFTPSVNATMLQVVPFKDPNYDRVPWAHREISWGIQFSVGPFLGAFAFAAVYALSQHFIKSKKRSLLE